MADKLFLDDLHAGQRFTGASYVLDAEQVKRFASAFDPQPFHLDESAAAKSLLGGLAASGWHIAAVTMRLLVGGGAPIAGGILGVGAELSWPRPTRPGDALYVVSEVTEVGPSRSRPDRASSSFGARLATSAARLCRCSRQGSWSLGSRRLPSGRT